MTNLHLNRRPVYRRNEAYEGELVFCGWATPKQDGAEIAGKFLPPRKGMWRKTITKGTTLIVEYHTPTVDEQITWDGRSHGQLSKEEWAILDHHLSDTARSALNSSDRERSRRMFNKVKWVRRLVQHQYAHG